MIRTSVRVLAAAAFLMSTLAGCAAETGDEDENVAESEDRLLAGRKVPESEVATALRNAGFPESVVGTMVCTAKYESAFYERALNKNNNGSRDYGLFQINSVHLGSSGCPSSANGLYTAAANAKCAYRVYQKQGLNAWVGYKKHRTECNNYDAPGSVSGSSSTGNSDPDPETEESTSDGSCWSGTLDTAIEEGGCVQSKFDDVWYQCNAGKWYRGGSSSSGPYGSCTSSHAQ